jgi:hypothetical protein
MNFTNCHVTIHAVNNYATVTVLDPSNNTTFDISASNAYSPYYTYQTAYNRSNAYCHPVTNSFGSIDISSNLYYSRMPEASGPTGTAGTAGMTRGTVTTSLSDMSRPFYSYYN